MTADGRACTDVTTTNGSANVSSAGQCQWSTADINKLFFITNACVTSCGAVSNLATSITILPSTQLTVARIAVVTDANHITLDCNAPANCASPNATQSLVADGLAVFGTDETTALNAAHAAAVASAANSAGCYSLQFPAGIILFSNWLFQTTTGNCNGNGTTARALQQIIQYAGSSGGDNILQGAGPLQTFLVPLPNFNFTCPPSGVYIGGYNFLRNLTITGFGQSMLGAGLSGLTSCKILPTQIDLQYVNLNGWIGQGSVPQALNTGGGFTFWDHLEIMAFGNGCTLGGSEVRITNSFGCSMGYNGSAGAFVINGNVYSENNSFTCGGFFGESTLNIASGAIFISRNDHCLSLSGGPTQDTFHVAGYADISGFDTQGVLGNFHVLNGGVAVVAGYKNVSGGNANPLTVDSGGIFKDLGGNMPWGTLTINGTVVGEANSANAVAVTAAKLVLSSGWGSTAANTALTGGDAPIQFTITNSGTGQAASPTITYTFPTPYPVAPFSCSATQIGGTNATGTFTSSALSATGVTFTFSLTPTASSTEIVQVTCVTP